MEIAGDAYRSHRPHPGWEMRRTTLDLAEDAIWAKTRGAAALAVTEMATNLVKHAGSGTMVVQRVQQNGTSGCV